MAGRVRDLLVCELDSPPAARPDDEPPALSDLSGGPVFMGDVLLGIARQLPRQRGGHRVECVPLGQVLAAEPFVQAYRRTGTQLREEYVHGNFPKDLRYETEYAQALGVAYRRTKIFGLDELSRHDSEWDLDTAYLSLEAQAEDRAAQRPHLPQRIEGLLTDRPRVLLRGEAGAGKTTLLWWPCPPSGNCPCRPPTTVGTSGCCARSSPGSPISGWTPPPGAYWTSPRCTPGRACGCRSTGWPGAA